MNGKIKFVKHGGETGIRTQGPRKGSHAFEACAFNHSAISPSVLNYNITDTLSMGYGRIGKKDLGALACFERGVVLLER